MVRHSQAILVHGRDQRAQAASRRPPSIARRWRRRRNGEADVTHVKHRRMDDQTEVLQQRD